MRATDSFAAPVGRVGAPRTGILLVINDKVFDMLVVTAEVWPYGNENRKFLIGSIFAANEGADASGATYQVAISQLASAQIGIEAWSSEFEIGGHTRQDGVWRLVEMILQRALAAADAEAREI